MSLWERVTRNAEAHKCTDIERQRDIFQKGILKIIYEKKINFSIIQSFIYLWIQQIQLFFHIMGSTATDSTNQAQKIFLGKICTY